MRSKSIALRDNQVAQVSMKRQTKSCGFKSKLNRETLWRKLQQVQKSHRSNPYFSFLAMGYKSIQKGRSKKFDQWPADTEISGESTYWSSEFKTSPASCFNAAICKEGTNNKQCRRSDRNQKASQLKIENYKNRLRSFKIGVKGVQEENATIIKKSKVAQRK